MTKWLAATITSPSGTRCAAQMALLAVGSERMWKTKTSSGSPTTSISPAPPSGPKKPYWTARSPISWTASLAVQTRSAARWLSSYSRMPTLRREVAGRSWRRAAQLASMARRAVPFGVPTASARKTAEAVLSPKLSSQSFWMA